MNLTAGNVYLSPEGGVVVPFKNGTGVTSVKGMVVHISSEMTVDYAQDNIPDAMGVIYEGGVGANLFMGVVVSGIAEVMFSTTTTAGQIARTFVTADAFVEGKAMAEAMIESPFSDDKHFCEIGHVLESRGVGLAKVCLHFN